MTMFYLFPKTRHLIEMIIEVIKDLVYFFLVFLGIMVWFSILYLKLDEMGED